METTIEQQVAMDEALIPSAQRNILHICPRVQGQSFAELPFEEEILDFIRFLEHSATVRTLTDVNINKLYHPWRSSAAIINKCLTGKTSGYDIEHKNQKNSNEMYYPRFTKVIIHHFMSKDPSFPRRNKFDALLPIELTNEEIRNSKAYKEYYAIATGEATPKPKASARRTRSGSDTSITPPTAAAIPRPTVAMTEAQQQKLATKQSMQQTHISQPSAFGADEETGSKPEVPDVPTDGSKEKLSWKSTDDEGADDEGKVSDDDEEDERDDDEEGEEDNDDENKDGDEKDDADEDQEVEKHDDKDDTEESRDDDEAGGSHKHESNEETWEKDSFDPIPQTPKDSKDESDGKGTSRNSKVEDTHVTLTLVKPDGQQESSSVSSQFVTSMLNLTLDVGMESIFETTLRIDVQTPTSVAPLPITTPTMTSSTIATTRQTIMQTNQFAGAVTAIPEIVQHYMDQRMNEVVQVTVQLQSDRLREEAQRENDEFLITVDENINKIIKEQVKEQVKAQVSKILPRIENLYKALVDAYETDKIILDTYGETVTLNRRRDDDEDKDEEPFAGTDRGSKRRREGKETESTSTPSKTTTKSVGRSTTGYRSRHTSASESAFVEEPVQTTFQMEEPSHLEFETCADDQPIVQSSQHPEWFSQPKKPPSPDHDWNKTLPAVHGSIQLVDTLTPELLAGPTYNLVKGSCKSLIELEYHLEEVYKATTDQLDWVNPKGQQYPHNLLQPLALIPDNRGRCVISFAHFINNDLEYLRGGASSHKYTTSVTKTKAADYGHIKCIEDLFYGFAVNRESARDVYSKRRIIVVTELKIMEWYSYKHLDWITVQRDDDKLYKFKEGDFKRLRIQDIEDMLLLLVQGKLTNLTVKGRFAFNVSLRMFTRSIVIQRRVEDLQLGVESYQKKLNLTKPDTYRSNLKRKEAYTAYFNPLGFFWTSKTGDSDAVSATYNLETK
nr:hypothetical protein [Tanacetum cinerariifolium]